MPGRRQSMGRDQPAAGALPLAGGGEGSPLTCPGPAPIASSLAALPACWLDGLRPLSAGGSAPAPQPGADAFRPFGLDAVRIGTQTLPVREEVRATLPFARLTTFSRAAEPGRPRRRVLVVAPLAGGFPFLMRDLVVALLAVADEVGITEWPDTRHVPLAAGRFGFAENCMETAQMIRALAGSVYADGAPATTHVVGVCQGAVPALAGALLLADSGTAPASITLMGGPIDPARNPTRLWRILQERSLDALEAQIIETVPDRYPGAGRRVFPAWRQTDTFALYLWRQALTGGGLPLQLAFDDGDDPLRYPLARLCWTLMDVPGEFFMENVSTIFRANALARGTLAIAGHEVRGDALRDTVLLTVEGAEDDIAALTQTEAAHDVCPNVPEALRRRLLVPRAGHFALFYGGPMRTHVIPAIDEAMGAAPG